MGWPPVTQMWSCAFGVGTPRGECRYSIFRVSASVHTPVLYVGVLENRLHKRSPAEIEMLAGNPGNNGGADDFTAIDEFLPTEADQGNHNHGSKIRMPTRRVGMGTMIDRTNSN